MLCLGGLFARRALLGAELGGPMRWRYATACAFVALWFVYIAASAANAYGAL